MKSISNNKRTLSSSKPSTRYLKREFSHSPNDKTRPAKRRKIEYPNGSASSNALPSTQKQQIPPHDLNVKRALPDQFRCNGRTVTNQFASKVRVQHVPNIELFFSAYTNVASGHIESDLIRNLVQKITKYGTNHTVVGCVAWLSNPDVLNALSRCRRVCLIMNHEDFSKWGNGNMMVKYKCLPKFDEPFSIAFGHMPNSPLAALEPNRRGGRSKYATVRGFGHPSLGTGAACGRSSSKTTRGLEHCKYLIFFAPKCFRRYTHHGTNGESSISYIELDDNDSASTDDRGSPDDYVYKEVPCAVWTGSMNMTKAAQGHHENAVFIQDRRAAEAYFHDFATTFMASSPLSSSQKSQTPARTTVSL